MSPQPTDSTRCVMPPRLAAHKVRVGMKSAHTSCAAKRSAAKSRGGGHFAAFFSAVAAGFGALRTMLVVLEFLALLGAPIADLGAQFGDRLRVRAAAAHDIRTQLTHGSAVQAMLHADRVVLVPGHRLVQAMPGTHQTFRLALLTFSRTFGHRMVMMIVIMVLFILGGERRIPREHRSRSASGSQQNFSAIHDLVPYS